MNGSYVYSLSDPAEFFEAITPSDTVNFRASPTLSKTTRAIYTGSGGTIVAVREDGTAVTFANVPAGAMLSIRAIRINATGTTATGLARLA